MPVYTRGEFLGAALGLGGAVLGGPGGPGAESGGGPGGRGPALVLLRGRVLTSDTHASRAEAFAVKDGRFLAVGSTADIANLKTAGTRVIDAAGRTVVPGFIDAHSHPAWGGSVE